MLQSQSHAVREHLVFTDRIVKHTLNGQSTNSAPPPPMFSIQKARYSSITQKRTELTVCITGYSKFVHP